MIQDSVNQILGSIAHSGVLSKVAKGADTISKFQKDFKSAQENIQKDPANPANYPSIEEEGNLFKGFNEAAKKKLMEDPEKTIDAQKKMIQERDDKIGKLNYDMGELNYKIADQDAVIQNLRLKINQGNKQIETFEKWKELIKSGKHSKGAKFRIMKAP